MASTGTGLLRLPPINTFILVIALVLVMRQQDVAASMSSPPAESLIYYDLYPSSIADPPTLNDVAAPMGGAPAESIVDYYPVLSPIAIPPAAVPPATTDDVAPPMGGAPAESRIYYYPLLSPIAVPRTAITPATTTNDFPTLPASYSPPAPPPSTGNEPFSDNYASDGGSSGGSMTTIEMIATTVAVAAFFLLILQICCICKKCRARNRDTLLAIDKAQASRGGESLQPSQTRIFSPQQLRKATKNYHDDNKLGQGGFGSVYKGTLHCGQQVAVKKLTDPNQKHADSQFEAEVNTISSVRHRNLIRLLGYCIDGRNKYLIYEFLENLSLDKHLFVTEGQSMSMLSWNVRREIIQGTAKGLSYLHHDLQDRIVHRDIKAANILLNKAMEPKIADFGLARLFPYEQTHHTTMVAGTIGYLAPEVFKDGHVTQRSDTYSFGVVILEILSGRRAIDGSLPSHRRNLLEWAWALYEKDRLTDLMDPYLAKGEYTEAEVSQLIWLALMCTQALPERRPTMRDVVLLFERKKDRYGMGSPIKTEHPFPFMLQLGDYSSFSTIAF